MGYSAESLPEVKIREIDWLFIHQAISFIKLVRRVFSFHKSMLSTLNYCLGLICLEVVSRVICFIKVRLTHLQFTRSTSLPFLKTAMTCFLEVFNARLEETLATWSSGRCFCLWLGHQNQMVCKLPCNARCFMILRIWLYETRRQDLDALNNEVFYKECQMQLGYLLILYPPFKKKKKKSFQQGKSPETNPCFSWRM